MLTNILLGLIEIIDFLNLQKLPTNLLDLSLNSFCLSLKSFTKLSGDGVKS